jgi:20S proteasome subunit beta 6
LHHTPSPPPSPSPSSSASPPLAQLTSSRFSPYDDNGGSILAIAGADFSVIAGDTRQTQGYSIQTRYAQKVFQL